MGIQHQHLHSLVVNTDYAPAPRSNTPGSSRWLIRFLESKNFLRLPAKNLQALIAQLREVKLSRGETVTHVGDLAEHYYIVKQGSLDVFHGQQLIVTLNESDGFGEELLGDNQEYLFDITAHSDSIVMKLPRSHFLDLLATPTLSSLKAAECLANDVILDINEESGLSAEDALHIAFSRLRLHIAELDSVPRYIVTHKNQGLRAAGAFSLSQLGYNAVALEGEIIPATIADNTEEQSAISLEITALEDQIKSLETLVVDEDGDEVTSQTPRNTSIACVERDDQQLWTPIFCDIKTANLDIATEYRSSQHNSLFNQETITTVNQPTNWLDDDYVWEKVLGFDSTAEVEELIIQEEKATSERISTALPRNTNPFLPRPTPAPALTITTPLPIDTKAQIHKTHHNMTAQKQFRTIVYSVTLILAMTIAATPFVIPNTWNKYAAPLFNYLDQSKLLDKPSSHSGKN